MSYRVLGALPVVATVLTAVLVASMPPDLRPGTLNVIAEVAKVMALVGLAVGAITFDRTDYLRRGWGLLAGCYVCLLVRDAWVIALPGAVGEIGKGLLVVLGNVLVVGGTWTLARAWRVAGLEEMESNVVRYASIGGAVFTSLVFAGPAMWVDLQYTLNGHGSYYWMVASDLGDLLALPVLAPVALTALAVKDGTLRWPWGLLTASLAAWLLYDGVLTMPDLLKIDDRGGFRFVADCCRVLATTSAFAAGMAQRQAMRELDD
jgi:hypothetical protein